MKESFVESCEEPLCVFCVSAAFFIRGVTAVDKSLTAPSGRQQFPFSIPPYSGLRFGRVNRNKPSTNLLLTIADLFGSFKTRRYLSLEEILATIQNVWQEPENFTFRGSDSDMEKSYNKSSVQETRSPAPQRRRLSVPETIMRKHNLALERSSLQESKHFHWDKDVECSSDPNLSRKKDSNLIRKSTLLRRLWGDSNKPKLSGSFQEWQHSYRKLSSTQSLNSNHSSPEHKPRKVDSTSPRRKFSSSPNRLPSKFFFEEQSAFNSPKRKTPVIRNVSLKALSRTPLSQESTTKYTCSSFTNVSDTNSDSAYSNSISFTSSPSSRTNTKRSENRNTSNANLQESAVQTTDVTNLNVISNVSLSQATLDVIFKEVMKDVGNMAHGDININTATVMSEDISAVRVDKAPSFFIDTHSDISSETLDNFIISKARVGSPYSKPTDECQPAVPRFSAVPRTSSMEVNTSEEDKEESDSVSFVDSLEDFSSPRILPQSRRSSSDVTQLLPEGKKDVPYSSRKSSSFFIPIQVASAGEARSVSELLPLKVRERIIERQQQREEKSKQYKSVLQPKTNNISVIKSSLNFGNYLPKKRTKPILPSIASLKCSSSRDKQNETQIRRKHPQSSSNSKDKKTTIKSLDNAKEYHVEPTAQKRIEILQIMECVEVPPEKNKKSKIPIAVSGNINKKTEFSKPTYLDLDNHDSDPKLDQLIANILIDSLNHDLEAAKYHDLKNANLPDDRSVKVNPTNNTTITTTTNNNNNNNNNDNNNKLAQHLDDIPEENRKPLQIQNSDSKASNVEKNLISKQKNVSSIPKGWVTVYTVQKDLETPESTSDEGKKYLMTDTEGAAEADARDRRYTEKNVTRDISNYDYQNDLFIPSSRHENPTFGSTRFHNSLNKFEGHHKTSTGRREEQRKNSLGDWSVTISGSNNYGQMAPDVEMRLKFPKKYRTNSNSSMEKENNQDVSCSFPKIDRTQKLRHFDQQFSKGRQRTEEDLPKIQTTRHKIKKREGSVISMTPSVIIPRPTKTSTSRYHFSRPRERYSLPDLPSILDERQYFEIVKRLPDILAVTGRSISPERRSFEEPQF